MPKYSKTWLFARKGWVNTLFILGITTILLGGIPVYGLNIQKAEADLANDNQDHQKSDQERTLITIQSNTLVPSSNHPYNMQVQPLKTIQVVLTAYSSRPQETDDTPFTTAFGTSVRDGVVANNGLPFGTKIKIPELYGNKIFTVEDRMNQRYESYHVDIWFASTQDAINFGVKRTYAVIY